MSIGEYEVERVTEEQFASSQHEWQACLVNSSADRLFASWDWCYSWWQTWSDIYNLELFVLRVVLKGRLVAIAPFFQYHPSREFGPSGSQLHIIGNAWRIGPAVRSEYTNLIIETGHEQSVVAGLSAFLQALDIDDVVIQDHSVDLSSLFLGLGLSLTTRAEDRGVALDVSGNFDDWLASLGKNTRLKVFNRRKYLGDRLQIFELCKDNQEVMDDFYTTLGEFHQLRRQQQPSESEIAFHRKVACVEGSSLKPVYSILKVNGEIVSLAYDIIVNDRQYNLQCVFLEDFDKKVSLGLLHLGYLIEGAFLDTSIHEYDLLAGTGKKTFYKDRLMGKYGRTYELCTSQVSISRWHYIYIKSHMFVRRLASILRRGAGAKSQ